jgi:hypothetical protein
MRKAPVDSTARRDVREVIARTAAVASAGQTPLEYLLAVMNDPDADHARRDRAASVAAPFLHPRAGEAGKKGERQEAADRAGRGKFAPAAPPRLVIDNKR